MFGDLASFRDLDVVELGCGTAYFSAWFAKLGARPKGVDITPAQLNTARSFQQEFGIAFPLIEASAEDVPLPDASFDVAFSEYGASIWCDPFRWIPEAARLVRKGGKLVFLRNSTLSVVCTPGSGPSRASLSRPQLGLHRIEWDDDESVEFHIPVSEMFRLLKRSGFEVLELFDVYAPEGASTRFDFITPEWATKWPYEEIWVAQRV